MNSFETSEKYRKYLIELRFKELKGYSVWGTDMEDQETDKLLLKDKKLLLFLNQSQIREKLNAIEHPYLDEENFRKWSAGEDFTEVYAIYEMEIPLNFNFDLLEDKTSSLELLDNLNLIQDFFIQINENLDVFQDPLMVDLKDFIYNNYFWKKSGEIDPFRNENTAAVLSNLYNRFYKSVLAI